MKALIPIRDLNPHRNFPLVTVILIIANVVAYIATSDTLIGITQEAAFRYGAVPCDVLGQCPVASEQLSALFPERSPALTIFTSMFMHGDILHLGYNMLFLWVFGTNVEDRLGRIRFPLFYLVTGLAAAFAHIAFNTASVVPIVGASGAISGVLGAYFLLWPGATVISLVPLGFFFFSIRTPAWVMLGLWFVVQLFSGLAGLGMQAEGGGVAFFAHIGGFIAGLLLIVPFGARRAAAARRHGHPDW